MAHEQTQVQDQNEAQLAQELSMARWRAPAEIAGYDTRRFLGAGAFGEVWVALDRNTNRLVAIKYFHPRSNQDWSILAREVEKLAFLSADRYVVQLLDVGWDATPPYYVMEYVEHGSLDELLKKEGTLSVEQSVELFRELAIGLSHAHGKGVLHCDLKPGNILLDQDRRPRLADFGQARLSHEQQPALGTLFYMAPEQADAAAIPDARWDVYALGSLLYCMLTGAPPYRTDDFADELTALSSLEQRLARYRQHISRAAPPNEHRKVQGIDRALIEIIDRCLATNPQQRFPNIQAVLHSLDERARRRRLIPFVTFGAVGPALLLTILAVVAWWWFNSSLEQSRTALTERSLQSLRFASQYVAIAAGTELEKRFECVEHIAADPELTSLLAEFNTNDKIVEIGKRLSDPVPLEMQLQPLRDEFKALPNLVKIQKRMQTLVAENNRFDFASWFLTDGRGLQIARLPESTTIGQNYAWRTYFHGDPKDHAIDWRPKPDDHLRRTRLSSVYRSQSTQNWSVAISTPVFKQDGSEKFLGILALTFEVGKNFIPLEQNSQQFPVLIDNRIEQDRGGLVIQHPLYDSLSLADKSKTEELEKFRVKPEILKDERTVSVDYADPLSHHPTGAAFQQRWMVATHPVKVREKNTGWTVMVQESYDKVLGNTLAELRTNFINTGIVALALVAIVSGGVWAYCLRMIGGASRRKSRVLRWISGDFSASRALTATRYTSSLSPTPMSTPNVESARRSAASSDAATADFKPNEKNS